MTASPSPHPESALAIRPSALGSRAFRQRHGVRLAYMAGAMYKGIGSKELVVRMGEAGLLGFLGAGGLRPDRLEADIRHIQARLAGRGTYGVNLLASPFRPEVEEATVELLIKLGVERVEAAAFTQITPALVRWRLHGLRRDSRGRPTPARLVLGKVSRPEVAEHFLNPAPPALVQKLVARGLVTPAEAELSQAIPMADDICVEADSGGHTDRGVLTALLPAILLQRDQAAARLPQANPVGIGAAGGLGTPQAIAAAFVLGADFVLTGSINQCTVEAGTSDLVKDLLQEANVQDTDIVPAGDMFEMGAKVQVFRKGLLFPARSKKLYDLWRQFNSLEEIDAPTRGQLETRYFKRPISEVWTETKAYYAKSMPEVIERAERDPKHKMALIFRWYFVRSSRLALAGEAEDKVDYQIHCGPALGSFNQWVRGTPLESWRNRHVDDLANRLMTGAAALLTERLLGLLAVTHD